MTTPQMHSEARQRPSLTCAWCPVVFTPKRASWAKFCSTRCRNAFNRASTPEAVKEARALVAAVLTGSAEPADWNPRARKLLGIKG